MTHTVSNLWSYILAGFLGEAVFEAPPHVGRDQELLCRREDAGHGQVHRPHRHLSHHRTSGLAGEAANNVEILGGQRDHVEDVTAWFAICKEPC